MASTELTIGRLARATGTTVQTIRHYERIGLMRPAARTAGNQRRYGERHMQRLAFVRHARELGFGLDAIRELLALADDPDRPCDEADRIAQGQLRAVRSRIARLEALRDELEAMVEQCAGRRVETCRIIEVLSDHSHENCLRDRH